MASRPDGRDDFEIAIVCTRPFEYDAILRITDQHWDEIGDAYGRAIGDKNFYTTGSIADFDVVVLLLPGGGKANAAGAAASLRSSYPRLSLVLLTGICGGVPNTTSGDEILLGDVIVSKAVVQYDLGYQYPDRFVEKDTIETSLGKPTKNIGSLIALFETEFKRERLESRAAELLEIIQGNHQSNDLQSNRWRKISYAYPGTVRDKLFDNNYRHKHHSPSACLCMNCYSNSDPTCDDTRNRDCHELCCDDAFLVKRERHGEKKRWELDNQFKQAQAPAIFVGRVGSGDRVVRSSEERDRISRQKGVIAFEMEGAGLWDELPCIIIKGVCNYADGHQDGMWQCFAAASAAAVTRGLIEQYIKTDKMASIQFTHLLRKKEHQECLANLRVTDPRVDKIRIQETKGGLLLNVYDWIVSHPDFQQWQDDAECRLLWIKGDPGKGKTMLLCGIIDELSQDHTRVISYFFCQATEERLRKAANVLRGLIWHLIGQQPSLVSYVQERYDQSGKDIFNDHNAWYPMSEILTAMLADENLEDAILIIDGLDECVDDRSLLLDFITQSSSSQRVKWVISSRNWPDIEQKLDSAPRKIRISLELNEESVAAAVRSYIQHQVHKLARQFLLDDAKQDELEAYMMSNAHGTFLWVALVCQELSRFTIKRRIFATLTSYPPGLDPLYQRMLDSVHDSRAADLCKMILAITAVAYRPLTRLELLAFLGQTKGLESEDLEGVIQICGSFLTLRGEIIYLVHQSAKDYLLDKACHQIFPSGIEELHYSIFETSMATLSSVLRRDIYNLKLPGVLIEQVSAPQPDPIAPIRYLCLHGIDHLSDSKRLQSTQSSLPIKAAEIITTFIREKYLCWLEALSLLQNISIGVKSVKRLLELVKLTDMRELAELIEDAYRFILFHKPGIASAPLQVHTSGLIFTPSGSNVKNSMEAHEPRWVLMKSRMKNNWGAGLQSLVGHCGPIYSMDISSDLSLIVTGSEDKTVRLWQVDTGDCLHILSEHTSDVFRVVFSPDSRMIASCSIDGMVRLWLVSTGQSIRIFHVTSRFTWNQSLTFSHNSTLLACLGEKSVKVWDTDTGSCRHEICFERGTNQEITSIAFSHNSSLLAMGLKGGTIKCWSSDTTFDLPELLGNGGEVSCMAFSHDLVTIASGSRSGIVIWHVDTGKAIRKLADYMGICGRLEYSRDSKLIASVSTGESARLWDIEKGTCLKEINLQKKRAFAIRFSPGETVTIAHEGNTSQMARVLRSDWSDEMHKSIGHTEYVKRVIFSPDSTTIASFTDKEKIIRLWDSQSGDCLQQLQGHESDVLSVIFSHDSTLLASVSQEPAIWLWHAKTGKLIRKLKGHNGYRWPLGLLAFSSDSKLIASPAGNGILQLWRVATGRRLHSLEAHEDPIGIVAFSHNSAVIASVSGDHVLRLWNVKTGKCLHSLGDGHRLIRSIAFSHDSTLIASASEDNRIRIWRVLTGECIQTLECNQDSTGGIAFSHDSKLIALTSENDRASINWRYGEYDIVWRQIIDRHSGFRFTDMNGDALRLWSVARGSCLQKIPQGSTYLLKFSADGSSIYTDFGRIAVNISPTETMVDDNVSLYKKGISLSQDKRWITWYDHKILWVPIEHQPICSAVSGSTVVFGCRSGEVFILEFSAQLLSELYGTGDLEEVDGVDDQTMTEAPLGRKNRHNHRMCNLM